MNAVNSSGAPVADLAGPSAAGTSAATLPAGSAVTAAEIEGRLRSAFSPAVCAVEDESAQHAGHAGAKSGGGHFRVRIIAERFDNLGLIARHRMVYDALADLMRGKIHALSIDALSPGDPAAPALTQAHAEGRSATQR